MTTTEFLRTLDGKALGKLRKTLSRSQAAKTAGLDLTLVGMEKVSRYPTASLRRFENNDAMITANARAIADIKQHYVTQLIKCPAPLTKLLKTKPYFFVENQAAKINSHPAPAPAAPFVALRMAAPAQSNYSASSQVGNADGVVTSIERKPDGSLKIEISISAHVLVKR